MPSSLAALASFVLAGTFTVAAILKFRDPATTRRSLAGFGLPNPRLLAALIAGRLVAGRRDSCGCFGTWSSRPLSWRDLVRNVVLTALGVVTALG